MRVLAATTFPQRPGAQRQTALTVAEHRAAQRAALLRAGEAPLLEAGVAGTNARAVCERAGLSRSSFYDYFATKDDLLVAIAIPIDAIERWDREIGEALADTEPGLAELRRFGGCSQISASRSPIA